MQRWPSKRCGAMDIKSPRRHNGIGRRFFRANLVSLGLTAVVAFILFYTLIPVYFRQAAKAELRTAGSEILTALDTLQTLKGDTEGDRQKRLQILRTLQEIQVSGKAAGAKMALVDQRGEIRFTNISDLNAQALKTVLQDLDGRKSAYVYVRIPFASAEGPGGTLYLFTKTEDATKVNRGVFVILALSLGIGGLAAFLFSFWQERRISRPMAKLMGAVEQYAKRQYVPVDLQTGDELQTLAETFNRMAHSLQMADEAQQALLQDISHELKTPLMSVQGYAEGIRDGVLEGDEAERSLDIIIDESQRLKRLVEDLLLLSRLEKQDSAYTFKRCSLEGMVRQAIDAVGGYAAEEGVRITLSCDNGPEVRMDPERAVRCLINILGNGIRYAHSTVAVKLESDAAGYRIIVSDDGPGFKAGEALRVFDRFYKGTGGGAGIGLTIAMTIALHHGWSLSAENGAEGGAEFILEIPAILS